MQSTPEYKFLNYEDALEWIFKSQYFGMKLGLDNTHKLFDINKLSKKLPKSIHIGGTNGKGSTCAILKAMLLKKDYKVGLFTSPHLLDYRERIQINNRKIPKQKILLYVNKIYNMAENMDTRPTFFEITFLIAWLYFSEKEVDFAIVEVGLGGRLDSTNVIQPQLSIITEVSLDHQHILGSTLEEIAREKSYIIKKSVPLVTIKQAKNVVDIFRSRALKKNSKYFVVNEKDVKYLDFINKYDYSVSLSGDHQLKNYALALQTLKVLGIKLTREEFKESINAVKWEGRFQKIDNYILDGAHNESAAKALRDNWLNEFSYNLANKKMRSITIFNCLEKKKYVKLLENILPITDFLIIPKLTTSRGMYPKSLLENIYESNNLKSIISNNIKTNVYLTDSVSSAIEKANLLSKSCPDDNKILITGSLFLVGEALAILKNKKDYHVSNE